MAVGKLQIVAFSGKMGVGKTTAALYLKELYKFKKVSFADKLKDVARELFPFEDQHFSVTGKNVKFNNQDFTPREFLIHLGQFLRYFDKDYFIKATHLEDMTGRIVIDDLRYLNEVEYLKKLGAKIIRIHRYRKDNPYKGEFASDPSETELDDYAGWDAQIHEFQNDKIVGLRRRIDQIMQEIL